MAIVLDGQIKRPILIGKQFGREIDDVDGRGRTKMRLRRESNNPIRDVRGTTTVRRVCDLIELGIPFLTRNPRERNPRERGQIDDDDLIST